MKAFHWLDDTSFILDGVTFQCCVGDYTQKTDEGRFILLKDRETLNQYATVLAGNPPRNALEFGIFQGGSPALFTLWFDLQKFVGIDISPPVAAFDDFSASHRVSQRIRSYYGTSQTDSRRIVEIVQAEFGDTPIDLIIDDASHMYRNSRRTFEIAFPLLRPGGIYVIEDWGWAHWARSSHLTGETALSMLVMELMMVCASRPDLISEIRIFPAFAFVRKSPKAASTAELSIGSLYTKRGIELVGEKNLNLSGVVNLAAKRLTRNITRALKLKK